LDIIWFVAYSNPEPVLYEISPEPDQKRIVVTLSGVQATVGVKKYVNGY
jgi:hypothetical protein